jgi:hypothetical protein
MFPKWTCALIALIGVTATSAALGSGYLASVKVTSTLAGKKTLPHRIRWVALPTPRGSVAKVEFVIDGKVGWIEETPPYVYGDDTNWLVTSWLAPGRHRFTVRAVTTGGRRTSSSIDARVLRPRSPPAKLATSRWSRVYTKAEAGDAPAGTWILSITKAGWKIKDPGGGANFIDVAYLGAGLLETRGGIWTRPRAAQEPKVQEGNGWCEDSNEPVRFRWSVNASKLELMLVGPSRCDGLGHFLSRTWTRAR